MSQPIDTAFVEVKPDVDGFTRTLKRKLDAAFAALRRDVDKSLADVDHSFRRASDRIGGHGRSSGAAFASQFTKSAIKVLGGFGGLLAGAVKLSAGLTGLAVVAATVATALAGLASASAALVPVIASLVASLVAAAGAAAILPGAIAIVVAAVNVLKLGMSGLKDAFKAVAEGDAEKLREALKKLAPNARAFVKQVAALKPAFDRLRLGVQQRLFAATAQTLKALAATTLPTVTAGFNRIADVLNRSVVRGLTALNTQANQRTLAAFFASAATAAGNLGAALRPVGQALLDLIGVGAQVTAELSGGVAASIGDFAKKISDLAASGGLKRIIEDGLAVLGQFAGLAADVLGIVRGIFSASGTGGKDGGIFGFFDRLNQLVNRPDIQQALSSVFSSLAEVGVALTPVLVSLLKALVPVAQAIGQIAVAFAPTLVTLATDLGASLASLAPAFVALAPAVGALGGLLAPLAGILTELVIGLAPGVETVLIALGAALVALAPAAGPVAAALSAILQAVAPLLPALGAELATILTVVASALQIVAAELGPLIGLWAELATATFQQLLPVFQQLAATAIPLATQVGQILVQAFAPLVPVLLEIVRLIAEQMLIFMPQIQQTMAQLIPIFAIIANDVGKALLDLFVELAPVIPELVAAGLEMALAMTELLVALAPLLPPLVALGAQLFKLMSGPTGLQILIGLMTLATGVITLLRMAVDAVITPFQRGAVAVSAFGEAVKTGINTAVGVVKKLPGQITSALGNLGSLLYNAGRDLIEGLVNGIKSAIGKVKDVLGKVTGLIPDWKGPEDEDRRLLRPAGRALMEGLATGIDVGADTIRRQLQGMTDRIGAAAAGTSSSRTVTPPSVAAVVSEERIARAIAKALAGMEWRFIDVDRVVSQSIGYRANLARRGG